jgi:asparagine synthase (glutamine-hydrolysing)
MCGIAGYIKFNCDEVLTGMIDVQAHRGPDDQGTWFGVTADGDRVGLGSRRLAILDLSPAGHMPMQSSDGQFTIVYNGEIYNYKKLRKLLEGRGYRFRSNSDTEAVLYMYQEFAEDSVRQLNGIFGFAIWDNKRQRLFLARDHYGTKPLYCLDCGNGRFAFSSELKSFTRLPDFEFDLDYASLHQYMTFLWVPEPKTMVKRVRKLPAGHFAIIKNGQLEVQQYWEPTYPQAGAIQRRDDEDLAAEVRERFSQVVRSQMQSDVPLGAFLSAGLDSSSIVACMAQHSDSPIHTYTITFPEHYRKGEIAIDDPEVAARTAKHFGCRHTEIKVDPDITDLLPKSVWHMDDPTSDPALLLSYLLCESASSEVTVLLSGVGGDELFAGYRKYQAQDYARLYRKIPGPVRSGLVEPLVKALPSFRGTALKGYVRLAKKLARSGSLPPAEQFVMDSVYLPDDLRRELYSDELRIQVADFDAKCDHMRYFESVKDADFVDQMMYLDSKMFMPSLNLNYTDKTSMASSVEVRVPFLDWEFADWVNHTVHPEQKLNGSTTKHILREAMRPLLPAEVLDQRKAGFSAPIDYWLKHDLKEMVGDLLSVDAIKRRGFFNASTVQRLLSEHSSARQDWSMQIWQLLTLELWMQRFIDQN